MIIYLLYDGESHKVKYGVIIFTLQENILSQILFQRIYYLAWFAGIKLSCLSIRYNIINLFIRNSGAATYNDAHLCA